MPLDIDAANPSASEMLVIRLEAWDGPWSADDPNANLKADVSLYSRVNPMATIEALAQNVGLSPGAIARYVLARYATAGSSGLLEIGPSMVHRLWEPVVQAERAGDDASRLAAYEQLRQMLAWLREPLVEAGSE